MYVIVANLQTQNQTKNKPKTDKMDCDYRAICPNIHTESTQEIDNWVKILV